MEIEKYINDAGKIAVLVSPGFGAGWSTWAGEDQEDFALFDRGLVQLALDKANTEKVEEYIKEKIGDEYFYSGGRSDITVEWLDPGTAFTVDEYDGSESLKFIEDLTRVA